MSVPSGQDLARKYLPTTPVGVQTSTITSTPEEEEDKGSGLIGDVLGGVGKTLSVGNQLLGLSNKYGALPILGTGSKIVASDTPVGEAYRTMSQTYRNAPKIDLGPVDINPFNILPPLGMAMKAAEVLDTENEEERLAVQKADSFTQAWREASGSDSFIEVMLAEVLADPTTWVTLGTAGAIEKIPFVTQALLRSQQTSGKLFNAWQKAKIGVRALEEVQALPITGIPKLAKGSINTVRRIPGQEDFLRATGQSLTDLTQEAKLKISNKKLDQAMRNLLARQGSTSIQPMAIPSPTAQTGDVYTPQPRIEFKTVSGKQPWEMTQEEFLFDLAKKHGLPSHIERYWFFDRVEQAVPEALTKDGMFVSDTFDSMNNKIRYYGYVKDGKIVWAAEESYLTGPRLALLQRTRGLPEDPNATMWNVERSVYSDELAGNEVRQIRSVLEQHNPNTGNNATPVTATTHPVDNIRSIFPDRNDMSRRIMGERTEYLTDLGRTNQGIHVTSIGPDPDAEDYYGYYVDYVGRDGRVVYSLTLEPLDEQGYRIDPDDYLDDNGDIEEWSIPEVDSWYLTTLFSDKSADPRDMMRGVNSITKYVDSRFNVTKASTDLSQDSAPFVHRWLVREAIEEGDEVPAHVLNEYPGLRAKSRRASSFGQILARNAGIDSNLTSRISNTASSELDPSIAAVNLQRPIMDDVEDGQFRTRYVQQLTEMMQNAQADPSQINLSIALTDQIVRGIVRRNNSFSSTEDIYSFMRAEYEPVYQDYWGRREFDTLGLSAPYYIKSMDPDELEEFSGIIINLFSGAKPTLTGTKGSPLLVYAHELAHVVEKILPEDDFLRLTRSLGAEDYKWNRVQQEVFANTLEKYLVNNGFALQAEELSRLGVDPALQSIYAKVGSFLQDALTFIRNAGAKLLGDDAVNIGAIENKEVWDWWHELLLTPSGANRTQTVGEQGLDLVHTAQRLASAQPQTRPRPTNVGTVYRPQARTASDRNMTPITPDQDNDTLWQRFLASGVDDTVEAREYFDAEIADIRAEFDVDPAMFEEEVLEEIDRMRQRYPSPLGSVMEPQAAVTTAPTISTTAPSTVLPTDWTDLPTGMSLPPGAERRVNAVGGQIRLQYRAIPSTPIIPTPPPASTTAPTPSVSSTIPGTPKTSNFDRTSPLHVSNLVGSASRLNVLRTLGDLNASDTVERQTELAKMSKPYLKEIWDALDPVDDEAYNDVAEFMEKSGFITRHAVPARIEASDTLVNATPTDWTKTSSAQLILDLAGVVKRGDVTGLETILNRRNNKTARNRAIWELIDGTKPFIDPATRTPLPTTMLEDALKKRKLITDIAATENIVELPRFSRSVQASRQSGAIPRANAAPEADATVDQVLSFRARELGVTVSPQLSSQIKRGAELNPDQFSARIMWQDPRIRISLDQALRATIPAEQQRHVENMFFSMNLHNSAFGATHPMWEKFRRSVLPTTSATRERGTPVIFGNNVHNAVLDDADVEQLSEAFRMRDIQEFQARYDRDRTDIGTILNKYAAGPQLNDWTTARELLEALDKNIVTDAADRRKLEAFLSRYDMTEEAAARIAANAKKYRVRTKGRALDTFTLEEAYLDKLLSKHFDAKARELGINLKESDKFFMKQLGWIPKAWREQALMSVRYHFANMLDMTIKSLIYGINPIRNMGAADWAERLGTQIPLGAFVGKDSRTLMQLVDNPTIQGVDEFLGEDAPTALGAIPVVGKAADPVVRFNRRFARATDNAFREWAWSNGSKDRLIELRPQLDTDIRRLMPGRSGADLIADIEKQGDKLRRSNGIEFSANKLRDMARARGASTEAANSLADTWQRAVDDASRYGVDMSNKVHFDYSKTYNIEDKLFLRKFLPFHFFATRNLPFYLETLAANPVLVNAWQAYQDVSEQDRISMGLPSNYKGMVLVDGFLEGIFGPGKIFVNPLATFSIFDTYKNLDRVTAEDTADPPEGFLESVGRPLKRLTGIGLGFAPWVNIPLSVAGFYGSEDEQLPVLRHSGVVQSLTGDAYGLGLNEGKGYDLGEQKFRDLQAWGRSLTTGEKIQTHTGSRYTDNQIVNRLAEDAIAVARDNPELDQKMIRDLFEIAANEGPGNILWDNAAKNVRKQEGARALSGFWVPIPQKQATEEAVNIMQATSGSSDFLDKYKDNPAFKRLAQSINSPLVAYTGYKRPRTVSTFTGESEGSGSDFDPSQLSKWGGTIWGPDKPSPYNNLLIMWEYLMWLDTQPEGAPRAPEEFFAQYNIM